MGSGNCPFKNTMSRINLFTVLLQRLFWLRLPKEVFFWPVLTDRILMYLYCYSIIPFICCFELMFNVPVNSYGHVGTLPPFYGTFISPKMRTTQYFKYNYPMLIMCEWFDLNYFSLVSADLSD